MPARILRHAALLLALAGALIEEADAHVVPGADHADHPLPWDAVPADRLVAPGVAPADRLVAPGVAPATMARGPIAPPAFRLPDTAAPESYDVHLAIDPRAPDFTGEITIALGLRRAADVLWLNATALAIDRVHARQGEREVAVEVVAGGEDFVGLRGRFEAGPARVRIAYRGRLDALIVEGIFRQEESGEWYALTQFQAIGARRAFPCFDEPGWKTPWQLTIDARSEDFVASNTPLKRATPLEGRPGWVRHEFARTKPLPSYLVALAVGPFDVVDGGTAGRRATPLRYLVPKGRGPEARYAAEVTPRLLAMVEDYFGTPYPFEKLDSVTIPHLVTFGAMENVGLVTYGSQYLLARPPEETAGFRESYAGLAAHEIAHMWFGNLVTLAWWDDTWLNEAFASWLGTKVTYAFEPAWINGAYRSLVRATALAADRLATTRRIREPVSTRNAIDDAFDDITYYKGEEVLWMFERWIGPERFQAGVRAFLARHAWGSATSEDFFRALGEAAGDSPRVLEALRGFVDQPGAPLLDVVVDCTGEPSIVVEPRRLRPEGSTAPDLEWTTPACFRYLAGGRESTHCAAVDASTRRIPLPGVKACPAWLVGNAGGAGHYVTRYWPAQLRGIAAHARAIPSFEMQALVNDTALLAEGGLLPMSSALAVAEAALGHPAPMVELAAVRLLTRLRTEWLREPERREMARIVRARVLPRASALGWAPAAGEADELRALRAELLPFAAGRAEGRALRPEARRLALRWIDDDGAVDAAMAPAILDVAGRFADAAFFDRLEGEALATGDQRDRAMLLAALVRARDPALRARALALALAVRGGKALLDGRSAYTLLARGLRDDESRGATFDYVRRHLDALEAKLPRDTPAALLIPMGDMCTPGQQAQLAAAFGARASRYMTGPLRYAQALERIDLCIAARR